MTPERDEPVAGGGLKRHLGLAGLVAYGLAYIAPSAPLATIGFVWQASDRLIALAYLLGMLAMAFTAFSYAVMVREIRTAGSVYGFARAVLGPFAGFMAGWLILLDYLLIPAFIYVGMSISLNLLMPGVGRASWILVLVGFTTAVNWMGLRSTTAVSMASVVIQIVMLAALVIGAAMLLAHSGGMDMTPFYHKPFHFNAVLAGTSICVMSFLGFDAVSTLAEDAIDPTGRTVGLAILAVLGLAGVAFVITAFVLGNVMNGMRFQRLDTATFELVTHVWGLRMAIVLAWISTIVVGFTNALPMQVGVARLLFAMGADRQLPSFLARLHPRHNTPYLAMIVSTVISLVVALLMRNALDRLTTFVNFGALVGFMMLHLCVLAHFHRQPAARRWGLHVLSPMIGLAVVAAILFGMNAMALRVGGGWLLAGMIYWGLSARHTAGAGGVASRAI